EDGRIKVLPLPCSLHHTYPIHLPLLEKCSSILFHNHLAYQIPPLPNDVSQIMTKILFHAINLSLLIQKVKISRFGRFNICTYSYPHPILYIYLNDSMYAQIMRSYLNDYEKK